MGSNNAPLSERIASSYKRLSTASINLNNASNELGDSIATLDAALKGLNLGVSTWVELAGHSEEFGPYWSRDIGYAKVGNKWGIALRRTSGLDEVEESYNEEIWLFNDAPRRLRIEGIEKVPDLLEKLIQETDTTTQKVKAKTSYAKELAAAISHAAIFLIPEAEEGKTKKKNHLILLFWVFFFFFLRFRPTTKPTPTHPP